MTRAQRRRHLAAWAVLGPLLIGFLAIAIAVRPASTHAQSSPQGSP
jgi:hypothetical protein